MYEKHTKARKYVDFRRMLSEMEKQIDAVVISTPDHTHYHPAMMAMELGKHCYCEKPMAHCVWEVREMTDLARKKGVATQLGVQRHTIRNVHRVVELIRSGAIGHVTKVYSWIGGTRGMPEMPKDAPPVPPQLNWDLWLGPARYRPYHPTYCPYGWRFWWDFGTGETGNWGCHILDIPFWALDLKYPSKASASGPSVDAQRSPKSMATEFTFPASGARPALTLYWNHADKGGPILKQFKLPENGNNTLFVGTDGMLLCGFGKHKLYPEEKFADHEPPQPSIPDSPGFYEEWIAACKGGPPATCDFQYSGPLTETVLLGNVAYRAGEAFEWDAANLQVIGSEAASRYIRLPFREGWEV
jgi:predicted dehydrogenase